MTGPSFDDNLDYWVPNPDEYEPEPVRPPMSLDEAIQRAIVDEAHAWQGPLSTPTTFCELLADLERWDQPTFDKAIRDVVRIASTYQIKGEAA